MQLSQKGPIFYDKQTLLFEHFIWRVSCRTEVKKGERDALANF